MRQHGITALDTFTAWDQSSSFTLSRRELWRGFERDLGLHLADNLLTLVFDHLSSGYRLGYDEWKAFLEGTGGSGALTEEGAAIIIQRRFRQIFTQRWASRAAQPSAKANCTSGSRSGISTSPGTGGTV